MESWFSLHMEINAGVYHDSASCLSAKCMDEEINVINGYTARDLLDK